MSDYLNNGKCVKFPKNEEEAFAIANELKRSGGSSERLGLFGLVLV